MTPADEVYVASLGRAYVLAPEQDRGVCEANSIDSAIILAAERLVIGRGYGEWSDAEEAQYAAWRSDLLAEAERELIEEGVLLPVEVPA